jgi:hypothetical protein
MKSFVFSQSVSKEWNHIYRRLRGRGSVLGIVAAVVMMLSPFIAYAMSGTSIEWTTIIGIIQAGNTVGSGTGKVTGGGQPWFATSGNAQVNLATGDVQFQVRGLVLAGGNTIGTPDGVTQVKGTLVCDTTGTATGNSTLVDTPLVPLSAQGNARFSGNVGALPSECSTQPNIAFLIRTGGGAWIGSGEVREND